MIRGYLQTSAATLAALATNEDCLSVLESMAALLCKTLHKGGKVLFCGNGGSAADCQHLAGELVVRFRMDRPALPGIALTVDSSVLTACLNDYGPEPVFSRQVEALGKPGDVLWAFSTSGSSANILRACETARKGGMRVIGFTGQAGGMLAGLCDYCFRAPSTITSHVQECHIAAGHMLCEVIEQRLFGSAREG